MKPSRSALLLYVFETPIIYVQYVYEFYAHYIYVSQIPGRLPEKNQREKRKCLLYKSQYIRLLSVRVQKYFFIRIWAREV